MLDAPVTILPGDELRVDRGTYHHHACYVGNGAVVQFGGRIKDKPHASIHDTSLADFAKDGRVKVLPHDELDRAAAVRRAMWLLDNPPPTTYNVFGYNCEHVARWCATGKIESSQAKGALTQNSLIGGGVFAFLDHPHGWLIGLAQVLIGLFLAWLSRGSTRKFEQHVRANWPGQVHGDRRRLYPWVVPTPVCPPADTIRKRKMPGFTGVGIMGDTGPNAWHRLLGPRPRLG